MLDLTGLQATLDPQPGRDPADELLHIAQTFTGATVEKRRTADTEPITLDGLQVDPDYQRPPDREKIAEFVKHLRAGGSLPPIKVNQRSDGSRWITDGQHRAAAAAIMGRQTVDGWVTHKPQHQEPQETNIVAKIAADRDELAVGLLLGAGARRDGKRLVLSLGHAGTVTYLPHRTDWIAKTERGQLQIDAPDARTVLTRLGLDELHPDYPAVGPVETGQAA